MQKIPIDLARPGMKLARPVLKDGGMVIMAEGMELSDSLIARLAAMKIDRITVEGQPVDLGGAGAGTRYAERVLRLETLFRRYGEDKWMVRVKERMVRYFRIKAAAQEARMKAGQSEAASKDRDAAGVGE
ncbi:hypothetical protein GKC30_14300 [Pseudodesulfovibrio sp. F-1]|uniref:Uncharacterized protein n=1 Tax=Pseudodesulfovibrio alkaliphilus TaxID=2661613 RepID=A0A7K1KRU6_9BACT|nr:hypothetical protein [Pseudodesulfovibrio alkaliphilus]MUM78805.1 hypothetical protein [Pseudodesulfovibrio alkaliphilus]